MHEPFLDPSWHRVSALKPRLRRHLKVHRHRYRGTAWYVLEDQASARVHRFSPAAYLFIGQMDGHRSVEEIWSYVVEQIGDEGPTQGDVVRLIAQLNALDLLQTNVAPDPHEMLERYNRQKSSRWRSSLANPLSIKIPLWDPDRFLNASILFVRPFFSRWAAIVWLLVVTVAIALAALNWAELTENLADRVLSAQSLIMAAVIFPLLKLFHELGHAYTTKRGGGPVHELGIMLLVFAPVPYVDASASISFRSKWDRALVGAAGMLVEVLLAAIATFVWVSAEPGLVRSIAFQVMFISGVSTIVFNANPLLRFDGYYILCDLLEIPNLGTRSGRLWGWFIRRFVFRLPEERPPLLPGERLWLVLYAPLALIYRTFVLFTIAIFMASRFLAVGVAIAVWGLFAGMVMPLLKGLGSLLSASRNDRHRNRAALIAAALACSTLVILFLVPFPLHTVAEGVVWLPDSSYVRANGAGFINALRTVSGSAVSKGTLLVETDDPELSAQIKVLKAEITELERRLTAEDFTDRVKANITRQEISLKQTALKRTIERSQALLIHSTNSGTFVAPAADDLPGRFVSRGDVLGYVIFEKSRTARVVVSQDDYDLIQHRLIGLEVKLSDRMNKTFPAEIIRMVPAASDRLPSRALGQVGGGQFATDPRDDKQARTLQRTFQIDIRLPKEAANSNFGSRVIVRFNHFPETIASRIARRLRQVFLARLEE